LNKNFLPTQPYKGTRDFIGMSATKIDYVFQIWRQTLEHMGYKPYYTPLVESLELYASKTSEEIVSQQLYSFTDRGDRVVAIRPELTPSLARIVAKELPNLVRPIRLYSIPACMRYEKPQKGRLREFYQLNVDILGGHTEGSDMEMLRVVQHIFWAFGAKSQHFTIGINHRDITQSVLDALGLAIISPSIIALIDRFHKIETQIFTETLQDLIQTLVSQPDFEPFNNLLLKTATQTTRFIMDWLTTRRLDDAFLAAHPTLYNSWQHIQTILGVCQSIGISGIADYSNVFYDPSIVRGFLYYTGVVFEVFDTDTSNKRALCGGGRYDNLVESFGGPAVSGMGFGLGDVVLQDFLTSHDLWPANFLNHISVGILYFTDNPLFSFTIADYLQSQGVTTEICLLDQPMGQQIKWANKQHHTWIIFQGSQEKEKHVFCAKNLENRDQIVYENNVVGYKKFLDDFAIKF
jgi:histidyl-tRNA synthetase